MIGGKNDMNQVNELRYREEARRRADETDAVLRQRQNFDSEPPRSWLARAVARARSAFRR